MQTNFGSIERQNRSESICARVAFVFAFSRSFYYFGSKHFVWFSGTEGTILKFNKITRFDRTPEWKFDRFDWKIGQSKLKIALWVLRSNLIKLNQFLDDFQRFKQFLSKNQIVLSVQFHQLNSMIFTITKICSESKFAPQ